MLFRIAFMVEEKRLGQTLAALHQLKVVNLETPAPVVVADDRPYTELLNFGDRKTILRAEIIEMMRSIGKSPTAVDYAIKQLTEAGVLKLSSKRGQYNVLSKKGKR